MGVRSLVPLGLVLVAVASLLTAVRVDAETRAATRSLAAPLTPVLSARRVPELLAAPVADRRLTAALDELLSRTPGSVCLTVSAGGRPVYARNSSEPLAPASLAKLTTAVAAIELLGLDTTFHTAVAADAAPVDGVVDGDLYLVGSGDPLLATDPYEFHFKHQPQTRTDFETLAEAIVAAGVTEVRGGVVGDESRYDTRRYVAAWPERFIVQDQTGPLSALSVNDGWIAFPPNPDTRQPDEEPASDPATHAAQVLTQLLAGRGVRIDSPARAGAAPGDVTEVAAIESPRVREVVAQMLRESDNQTAELLTKELGLRTAAEGTTAAGVVAIQDELGALGLPTAGAVVADGSGLAEENRTTCQLVQAVLDGAGPDSALDAALPIAGQTGTLTERFVGAAVTGRMRAKTGTLNEVTSLAGFVDTVPGARIAFSFIVNLPPGERVGEDDLALQDELAAILVGYPQGPVLADLGPKPIP